MGEEKGDDGTTESLDINPTGCRTFIGTIQLSRPGVDQRVLAEILPPTMKNICDKNKSILLSLA